MCVQHDSGTLNNQVDVAPAPHELFELTKQVALDTEIPRARAAVHILSIDLAFALFPKPGSNFGLSVLGRSLGRS
jgi:hypothetical protein